jgi:acetyl esterase/lipase
MGFSAGGHLASTVGTHFDDGRADAEDPVDRMSCRPDAMILCYPVITFGEYRHHGSMINLIGENPSDELIKLLSNELHVTPDTPPTFLWHTADDQAVPVQNSLLFAEALRRCGVPFELHIYPHGRHGLGLALGEPSVSSWTELCARWLKNLGF